MRALAAGLPGHRAMKVGEEPWISLAGYEPRGNSCKGVRAGRNQALRVGCVIEEINLCPADDDTLSTELRGAVESLFDAWRATTAVHIDGLFMCSDPFAAIPGRRTFLCRRGDTIDALLTATPVVASQSYYLEDVIMRPGERQRRRRAFDPDGFEGPRGGRRV